MKNSLKQRELIGLFVGAFIGTLISWFTLGQTISWVYTLAGLILGAAGGYYNYDILQYARSKAGKAYNTIWLIGARRSLVTPRSQSKPKPKLRVSSATRNARIIRRRILAVSIVLLSGIFYLPLLLFPGKWMGLFSFIHVIWFLCSLATAFLMHNNTRRETSLRRSQLISLGTTGFILRAFHVIMGSALEVMCYVVPALLLTVLVFMLSFVGMIIATGIIAIPYFIVVLVLRLLYLTATKRGYWFSATIGAVVVFLSLWYRPWTEHESLLVVFFTALVNGSMACGLGMVVHILLKKAVTLYNIKGGQLAPTKMMYLTIYYTENFFRKNGEIRIHNGLYWLHQKLPLSPVFLFGKEPQ